jgi:hypothetical protein
MKELNNTKIEKIEKIEEGLKIEGVDTSLPTDFATAFCESNQQSGKAIAQSCQKLTQNNCRSTSCCIWTSGQKCQAGNQDGLLFTSNNSKPLDYYYYKDTCYGKNCIK